MAGKETKRFTRGARDVRQVTVTNRDGSRETDTFSKPKGSIMSNWAYNGKKRTGKPNK
jgi:hypothetical protein